MAKTGRGKSQLPPTEVNVGDRRNKGEKNVKRDTYKEMIENDKENKNF